MANDARPLGLFEDWDLRLANLNEQGRTETSLYVDYSKQAIRLNVRTNEQERDQSNNYGKIQAELKALDFENFLAGFKYFIENTTTKGHWSFPVERRNFQTRENYVSEKIVVGRGEDGFFWMSIVSVAKQNRPKIRFVFKFQRGQKWLDGEGAPLAADIESKIAALGWYNTMNKLVLQEHKERYVPREKQDGGKGGYNGNGNGGNGGNRGYNSNGNNPPQSSGGNQQSSGGDDWDEDIPM